VLNLATEFIRRGIACEVFSMHAGNELADDFARQNIRVSYGGGGESIFEDRVRRLLVELKRFAPTAIIAAAGLDNCELLRYVPAGVTRIGVFHLVHGLSVEVAKTYRQTFDRAVAVSPEVERSLREVVRGETLPIHCVGLGVAMKKAPGPRTFSAARPLRILYLGRLERPAKRVEMFPAIFEHLKTAGIPFVWSLVGDGPEREFLQSRMSGVGTEQTVSFRGVVPHFAVPDLLAEHDVFLLTSSTESFCLSLHEAMAAGLVAVAGKIPGRVGEIVTARTGRPVPPDDASAYAEAIVWLHRHREEMAEMSAAAMALMTREHSTEAMADRWLGLLAEVAPTRVPVWPDQPRILPPLGQEKELRYFPPVRLLRRWLAKFQPDRWKVKHGSGPT